MLMEDLKRERGRGGEREGGVHGERERGREGERERGREGGRRRERERGREAERERRVTGRGRTKMLPELTLTTLFTWLCLFWFGR